MEARLKDADALASLSRVLACRPGLTLSACPCLLDLPTHIPLNVESLREPVLPKLGN